MRLQDFTPARVGLRRSGCGLPTREMLDLQWAHARARRAVHSQLNVQALELELRSLGPEVLVAHSAADNREIYLRRPDLGRQLNGSSRELLRTSQGEFDAAFLIADGLSALAVELHAAPMLKAIFKLLPPADWNVAPLVIVQQGRVAIGDEAGQLLGAALSVVLIGERPGLSAADSLGIYLTWDPRPGATDADRNCISNIRADGLSYNTAAFKLTFLMTESRRRKLSGVDLKENAQTALLQSGHRELL